MKAMRTILLLVVVLAAAANLIASGPVGIYALIEKVIFEPNDKAPERIQVWGAFKFVEGSVASLRPGNTSPARRGYLFFRLPSGNQQAAAKAEWADLKVTAGTGQAIGFGYWGFVGAFNEVESARSSGGTPYFLDLSAPGNPQTDVRIRAASDPPTNPAPYGTNAGIVKLTDSGSHADIIKQLKEALRTR